MTGRVFAYCRVSGKESAKSDISIPTQRASARDFKKKHYPDMPWAEESYPFDSAPGFFVDRAVSAWSKMFDQRMGSSKILELAEAGDVVIIHSVDRGFRNVADYGNTVSLLTKKGVTVRFSIDESVNFSTASGKFMGNLLATVAQYSSDIKSERTREARAMVALGLRKSKPRSEKKVVSVGTDWGRAVYADSIKDIEPSRGRVFGYIRCSHVKSLESGLGLSAQEEAVSSYISNMLSENDKLEDMGVAADEAVSAFTTPFEKRPWGGRIWEQLRKGDHLVVYRLDRAWRSIQDCARMVDKCIEKGIIVHLVQDGVRSDDKMGQMHFHTMSYVAWLESYIISRRWKETIRHLKSQGRKSNKDVPFGSKVRVFNNQKKVVADLQLMAEIRNRLYLKNEFDLSVGDIDTVYNLWASELKGKPSWSPAVKKKAYRSDTWHENAFRKYRGITEKLNNLGIKIPHLESPMDHPRFEEYLLRTSKYRCKRQLIRSKCLEALPPPWKASCSKSA